jgi:putative nucleotidyltransferase with HDIG domain
MTSVVDLITLEDIMKNDEVQALVKQADDNLAHIGYTEHGYRHAKLVANIAHNILSRLGYSERTADLAAIAGYLHDIGNIINRRDHANGGAVLAFDVLRRMGMGLDEIAQIVSAIGNHAEEVGEPVSVVSAAVIIADKSDVHRSRVRNPLSTDLDVHDRVNYASEHSFVRVDAEKKTIALEITVDKEMCRAADYFEIFMERMQFVKRAAAFLGCEFELLMNEERVL